MTRLLVAGVGPRPGVGFKRVLAPGLRLHTIAGELIRAGHEVHIAESRFGDDTGALQPMRGAASIESIPLDPAGAALRLEELCAQHQPGAVIALTELMGFAAAIGIPGDVPLYVDYNGHPMAERQMLCHVAGSNGGLADQWALVLPVLIRADRFATCSRAQRLALIGELGGAGRLNAETCGHELVDVLRPPLPFDKPFVTDDRPVLRGNKVPADARIMLFSGGYNTWLDEALLFDAVEHVLSSNPSAYYVSTGGEITGHVTEVFARFQKQVSKSPHRDRYVFVGWLDHEEYELSCVEADVGLVCDRATLEGELGCRNRLYGWIWGGMRAVATDLSEIVREHLGPAGLVTPVSMSDRGAFGPTLRRELEEGRYREEDIAARREMLREVASPELLYRPLVEWCEHPALAPDRGVGEEHNPLLAWADDMVVARHAMPLARELVLRMRGSRLMRLLLQTNPEARRVLAQLNEVAWPRVDDQAPQSGR